MGYYTYFSLSMQGKEEDINKVISAAEALEDKDDNKDWKEGIRELVTFGGIDAKWYNFEEDFIPFAKQFPDVLFIVDGSGEEEMDIWQLRIKGDETEQHQVVMPPFTNPNLFTEHEKEILNN